MWHVIFNEQILFVFSFKKRGGGGYRIREQEQTQLQLQVPCWTLMHEWSKSERKNRHRFFYSMFALVQKHVLFFFFYFFLNKMLLPGVFNWRLLIAPASFFFSFQSISGCFLSYCLPAPFCSSMSPLGVEAQSPLIAAGHRSLCPWRRQPTYCQLVLKWRTFHHPTENTIKNMCTSGRPSRAAPCHKFSYNESASPSQIFTFPATVFIS